MITWMCVPQILTLGLLGRDLSLASYVKSAYESQVAHQAGAYPGFRISTPPAWMGCYSPSQG